MIGFSNGNLHKLYSKLEDRFSDKYLDVFKLNGLAEAIELNCGSELHLDYLLNFDVNLSSFKFRSLHAPSFFCRNNEESNRILSKLKLLHEKYLINNFVFHADQILEPSFLNSFNFLPISIENMDNLKSFGKSLEDVSSILDSYDFKLSLDLQHCFTNDPSMILAYSFQEKYGERIAEYHISGYDKDFLHFPLFKKDQEEIIKALSYPSIAIIIESSFLDVLEPEKELKYIRKYLDQRPVL